MAILTATATMPVRRETRAPVTVRAQTSRPKRSVPKRWSALGGRLLSRGFCLIGSNRPIQGARRASITIVPRMASPNRALPFFNRRRTEGQLPDSIVTDAGVEQAV